MNNRGQTLILFLLVIPIIVGFLAFFIDLSMVNYERNRLDSVIVSNLEIVVNEGILDLDLIKELYLENGIVVDNIDIRNNQIIISLDCRIKSLFGKILDFDIYKIKCNYIGDYENKEVYKDEGN